jgi:hypothetical protein
MLPSRFADFPSLRAARAFMRLPEAQAAVVVVAARAVLEASGIMRKAAAPPMRHVADLSVAELNQWIAQTKRQLELRETLPVN